jgi:hypothetical protein
MEKGTIVLKLGTCDVEKYNVTPAEALFYMVIHRRQGRPLKAIRDVVQYTATDGEVMRDLSARFGKRIKAVFPGPMPRIPHTFAELKDVDLANASVPEVSHLTGVEVSPEDISKDLPTPGGDE